MKAFARYVGIDYSGAQTPANSLPGLRIFEAEGDAPAFEVPPPPSPRKYWARREIAEWLVDQFGCPEPLLVGIDHGFSFPLRYFEVHGLKPDWPLFLDDFQRHWPTDENIYVESVLEGREGNGAARSRGPRLASHHGETSRRREICFSIPCPGFSGKIDACRNSLATVHPPTPRQARPLLAFRRLGGSRRPLRHR
jgi:hypothetical protein